MLDPCLLDRLSCLDYVQCDRRACSRGVSSRRMGLTGVLVCSEPDVVGRCRAYPLGIYGIVCHRYRPLAAALQRPTGRLWAADTEESEQVGLVSGTLAAVRPYPHADPVMPVDAQVVAKEEAPVAAVVPQAEAPAPSSGGLPWFIDPNTRCVGPAHPRSLV